MYSRIFAKPHENMSKTGVNVDIHRINLAI